jgi:uncharacterized protein
LSIGLPSTALGVVAAEYETRDLILNKLSLQLQDWPKGLDGYKIAHLSDLHLETLKIPAEQIAQMSNSIEPDLLVITGDIIEARGDISKVVKFLDPLKARDGKFIVMGNNDYQHFSRTHFKRYIKELQSMGFSVLINSSVKVTKGNDSFWVVGVDDPATAHDDVELSFSMVHEDGLPRIVLSHSTDCIDDLYPRKVDLFLTGHTHGGQVVLPFVGPPITNTLLADEGIYEGYHLINGINVFINKGIGTSGIPIRIGANPEIACISLLTPGKR